MSGEMVETPGCRSCGHVPIRTFLSLGKHPLPDRLVDPARIGEPEPYYPLDVAFCESCSLVQLLGEVDPEALFAEDYPYYSSFSQHLLDHSKRHAEDLIRDHGLGPTSLVVELASNDGYLLRNFVEHEVPVLGIDPAEGPAKAAREIGVPTLQAFFGPELARELVDSGRRADVIIANNVMAHIPDLNGFVAGMATLLADDGHITVENPYVRDLIQKGEFDTIYHEHFFYHSCSGVQAVAERHGLFLNDVEYFPELHGGTLRWHLEKKRRPSATVAEYLGSERELGMHELGFYAGFGDRVEQIRRELRDLLLGLRAGGATIAAYGAAAKGSTLINYAGLGTDVLDFVVDRNVHKHGLLMPGQHLPIRPPEALVSEQPDYTLILAWNFADEIVAQQEEYRSRGGRFIVPIPEPVVLT